MFQKCIVNSLITYLNIIDWVLIFLLYKINNSLLLIKYNINYLKIKIFFYIHLINIFVRDIIHMLVIRELYNNKVIIKVFKLTTKTTI